MIEHNKSFYFCFTVYCRYGMANCSGARLLPLSALKALHQVLYFDDLGQGDNVFLFFFRS